MTLYSLDGFGKDQVVRSAHLKPSWHPARGENGHPLREDVDLGTGVADFFDRMLPQAAVQATVGTLYGAATGVVFAMIARRSAA